MKPPNRFENAWDQYYEEIDRVSRVLNAWHVLVILIPASGDTEVGSGM